MKKFNLDFLPSPAQELRPNHFIINLENIEYTKALKIQYQLIENAREYPNQAYYILCSHPHCLTNGRGLQKKTDVDLVEFNEESIQDLNLPLHPINRGGGLTFHYPGQYILYPIINLNFYRLNMNQLMLLLIKELSVLLNQELDIKTNYKNQLLGLWYNHQKLASIGMGLERWVTCHGLALNLINDTDFFQKMNQLSPCGISFQQYTTLEQIAPQFSFEKIKHMLSSQYLVRVIKYINTRSKI
jgi:lipoyl(octanoyl) transferase